MDNDVLPQRYELRDQPRFQLGQPILQDLIRNRNLYLKRGNSADHFVVTGNNQSNYIMSMNKIFVILGPLPCLKSVKASYMRSIHKRRCLQCGLFTRVGIIFVHHGGHNVDQDSSKNHFLCEGKLMVLSLLLS